jgi:hypothetical protein
MIEFQIIAILVITYRTSLQSNGALRNQQLLSYSSTSKHFVEPKIHHPVYKSAVLRRMNPAYITP